MLIELLHRGIHATGTLRCNRIGLPSRVMKKPPRGVAPGWTEVAMREPGIFCTAWKDLSTTVYFLSTACTPYGEGTLERYHKEGGAVAVQVPAPPVARVYREHMGHVDRHDQALSYYRALRWWLSVVGGAALVTSAARSCLSLFVLFAPSDTTFSSSSHFRRFHHTAIGRRTVKAYMRLAWNLLDCAIINAFKYHEALGGKLDVARDQRQFREDLRDQLIDGHSYRKKMGRPAQPSNSLRFDDGKHLIAEHVQRLKRVCVATECTTRTLYVCLRCGVHICINCFASYHTR